MSGNGIQGAGCLPVDGSSTEVVSVARRRRFSDAYKRRIVQEVDRARRGEIGLILRREGLYSSQLAKWRNGRNDMNKAIKGPQENGDLRSENQRLQKENARLKLKLRKAEAMLELQKKAAEILGYADASDGSDS